MDNPQPTQRFRTRSLLQSLCVPRRLACSAVIGLAGGSLLSAGLASATDWNPGDSGGFYDLGSNWVGGSAPGAADSANFLSVGVPVTVTWDSITGNTTSSSVLIDNTDITFRSVGGPFTHNTTSGATVRNGGLLNLGSSPTSNHILNVGTLLNVSDGGTLNVLFNSQATATNFRVGNVAGADSFATIDGPGTSFNVTGQTDLGLFGSKGTLNLVNGATNNTFGTLYLTNSGFDNSSSELNVLSGSQMSVDLMRVGTQTGSGQSATVLVDGANSAITQNGAFALTLSSSSTSTAQMTLANGGKFITGTGGATINNTGTLNIQPGGTFEANGVVDVNGGTINAQGNGGNTLTPSDLFTSFFGSLTASNDGQVNFAGDHEIGDTAYTFNSGADLNVDGSLGVFQSSLVVDGAGTTVNTNLSNSNASVWGPNFDATITVRNDATYTINSGADLNFGNPSGSGAATLNVESGADFFANSIKLAIAADTDGTINVDGAGSTLTQSGASTLTVGDPFGSFATGINVTNGGAFTTGTGDTTINRNGTINVQTGGTFNAKGDLIIMGGSLISDSASTVKFDGDVTVDDGVLDLGDVTYPMLTSGKTLRAINNAQIALAPNLGGIFVESNIAIEILSGSDMTSDGQVSVSGVNGSGQMTVSGSGSTFTKTGGFNFIIAQGGHTGVVNIQDNAMLTTNSALQIANSSLVGTDGTLNITSGGNLVTNDVVVGSVDGNRGTGKINIDGTGSSLDQNGASVLVLGNADTPGNGGVHTINITNGATYFMGTGDATINATGAMNIASGARFVSIGADVNVNGGLITIDDGEMQVTSLQNNGKIEITGLATMRALPLNNAGLIEFTDPQSGVLSNDGNYVQTATGTLAMGLYTDSFSNTTANLLGTSGGITLDGQLSLSLDGQGATPPTLYTPYTILNSAGFALSGTFATVAGVSQPLLATNQGLAVTYNYSTARVHVTAALLGDTDLNGSVGFADFVTLSNNYSGPATGQTWSTGDFDGDGDVAFGDFVQLSNNWGLSAAAPDSAQADIASAVSPGEAKLIVGLDGSLSIEGGNVDLNGYSITSASGQLIADSDNNASPFTFYIANSATDITAGNLGTFANIDGLLALDASVNPADLSNLDLVFEYGTANGSVTGVVEVVPEPSSLVLLGLAGLLCSRRRRV